MATNMARNAPVVMASLEKNIFEHISLMAQEQVEIEFRQEMGQLQQMQQNPQTAQNPQMQIQMRKLSEKIEARKAKLLLR
jgi:tRNA U54 and U55 pseudouridine synthase Pus10